MTIRPVPVTARQAEIMRFVQSHLARHEVSPTLTIIADHFGTTRSNIHRLIHQLVARGRLRVTGNTSAAYIEVIHPLPEGEDSDRERTHQGTATQSRT